MEAWAGIEPANTGFADPCLTTWLPRLARLLVGVLKRDRIVAKDWRFVKRGRESPPDGRAFGVCLAGGAAQSIFLGNAAPLGVTVVTELDDFDFDIAL